MEFLWNNGVLAVVSLIIVIVVNFFMYETSIKKLSMEGIKYVLF